MLHGNAQIRCGNSVYKIKENDCLIINSNELHEGVANQKYDCFRFKIHPSFFDNKYYVFKNLVNDATITDLMNKIVELSKNNDQASSFKVKGYMYLFVSHLCANYIDKRFGEQQIYKEKIEKMNTVASFMHSKYASKITTEELARLSHYNYSHFCHTFKEVFGVSANKYLLTVRLNKACALLSSTNLNITEIAFLSGFPDPNYFTRIFKKEKGISPSDFRKKDS